MPSSIAKKTLPDFYTISRSHMYWGRKPFSGLQRILEDLGPGDTLLDPFCGGGTSIITALVKGARVIGSDLNPMAVFLSKVLISPVSLFSLEQAFETIRGAVAENILDRYKMDCPECHRSIYFDYLQWNSKNGADLPEFIKYSCKYCGAGQLRRLTEDEIDQQVGFSEARPEFWFPQMPIRAQRKTRADSFHELFTGRNLSALSELYNAIEGIGSSRSRQNLQYAFTAMLYSCSQMQIFSRKSPSSSRGWTAPRFYLPPARMEKNVWRAFEVRFKNLLNCRKKMNSVLGTLTVSDSLEMFEASSDDACVQQSDYLSLPFPQKLKVSHVFIDPPYNDDIDYMGFSEFWGSWLGMEFPIQDGWHPGLLSNEQNAERIRKLLEKIRENTQEACKVILAYGSKRRNAWKAVEEAVFEAGYEIQDTHPIFLDRSQKRKAKECGASDLYFVLKQRSKRVSDLDKEFHTKAKDISPVERQELRLFLRVSAYLLSLSSEGRLPSPERTREEASGLIRPLLREKLSDIKISNKIIEWTSDNQMNQRAYNTLCLDFINQILSRDGFNIAAVNENSFDATDLTFFFDSTAFPRSMGVKEGADFVASDSEDRRLIFYFFNRGQEEAYTEIADRISKNDQDRFHLMHFLIFPRYDDMLEYRHVDSVDCWPRGFFLSFGELLKRTAGLYPDDYGHFSLILRKFIPDYRSEQKIGHFEAEVESNLPIREGEDCKHFRIKFIAPELRYVVPGQFVMIDTLTVSRRREIENKPPLGSGEHPSYAGIVNLDAKSYLKRPFSIHRAFHPHFKFGYLKNIFLPPDLAPVCHTAFPNRFEIFYKVLDDGTGTSELMTVTEGDKIEMLGPLGGIMDLGGLRSQGITEVHLVGGGVGMAPLIFFGQALKFLSFDVSAFIGIDRIESLVFSELFAPTCSDDPKNAYVYIENLTNIGLDLNDIYISTEQDNKSPGTFDRIDENNCHVGFVSEQYEAYLKERESVSDILVIACGPQPMLRAMERITSRYDIPMKVLMEKRMACGIGVCMSCVCKTKKGNSFEYSRVCKEGPVFDAKDIVWD